MVGLLESVLTTRYGQPQTRRVGGLTERHWSAGPGQDSVLYYSTDWSCAPASEFIGHRALYGESRGGSLVGNSLKVALACGPDVFGLSSIAELNRRQEIGRAVALDPGVMFFMDAANVWFYGHKASELYVYDGETGELDCLGPLESAIVQLISEWEVAVTASKPKGQSDKT